MRGVISAGVKKLLFLTLFLSVLPAEALDPETLEKCGQALTSGLYRKGYLYSSISLADTDLGKRWGEIRQEAVKLFPSLRMKDVEDLHITIVYVGDKWRTEGYSQYLDLMQVGPDRVYDFRAHLTRFGAIQQIVALHLGTVSRVWEENIMNARKILAERGLRDASNFDRDFQPHITLAEAPTRTGNSHRPMTAIEEAELESFHKWAEEKLQPVRLTIMIDGLTNVDLMVAGASKRDEAKYIPFRTHVQRLADGTAPLAKAAAKLAPAPSAAPAKKGNLFSSISLRNSELGQRWAKIRDEAIRFFPTLSIKPVEDLHITLVHLGNWEASQTPLYESTMLLTGPDRAHDLSVSFVRFGASKQFVALGLGPVSTTWQQKVVKARLALAESGLRKMIALDHTFEPHISLAEVETRTTEGFRPLTPEEDAELARFQTWAIERLAIEDLRVHVDDKTPVELLLSGLRKGPGSKYVDYYEHIRGLSFEPKAD
jgi:2'-5' RNA ligase